jgi:hypothetical protein
LIRVLVQRLVLGAVFRVHMRFWVAVDCKFRQTAPANRALRGLVELHFQTQRIGRIGGAPLRDIVLGLAEPGPAPREFLFEVLAN